MRKLVTTTVVASRSKSIFGQTEISSGIGRLWPVPEVEFSGFAKERSEGDVQLLSSFSVTLLSPLISKQNRINTERVDF
jgi:hypothetical protein